jgi:hypothetical protein
MAVTSRAGWRWRTCARPCSCPALLTGLLGGAPAAAAATAPVAGPDWPGYLAVGIIVAFGAALALRAGRRTRQDGRRACCAKGCEGGAASAYDTGADRPQPAAPLAADAAGAVPEIRVPLGNLQRPAKGRRNP